VDTGPVMAGVATYEIGGQTYDRLVVEDARTKEVAVEAAQKAVDQSATGITLAQKTIDQANDGISLTQKNIDYLQQQINNSTMTAPFDGIIAKLYYKQGDVIPSPLAAPQVIIYLVDTGTFEVDVNIDELNAPGVQVGQTAAISLDALPGTVLQGKVSVISVIPSIQPTGSNGYVAKVNFNVPQGIRVKSGMNASVDIITQQLKNVLLLPNDAVKRDSQGKPYVQMIQNQNISNQPVVIGFVSGTQTQITSGLKEGDKVVTGVTWSLQGQ
jgi:HlyD family secretion protein